MSAAPLNNASKDIFYILQQHTPEVKSVKLEDFLDADLLRLNQQELMNTKVTTENFGEVMFLTKIRKYAIDNKTNFQGLSPADTQALKLLISKIPLCQTVSQAEDITL